MWCSTSQAGDINHETLKSINDLIYALLIKIYPTKSVEDFEIQRKAATVTFVGSGLSVDIVPVIEDPNQPGYGWQFDIHDGSAIQTCAPCQIKFVRDRKNQDRISAPWCGWPRSGATTPNSSRSSPSSSN